MGRGRGRVGSSLLVEHLVLLFLGQAVVPVVDLWVVLLYLGKVDVGGAVPLPSVLDHVGQSQHSYFPASSEGKSMNGDYLIYRYYG